MMTMTWADLVQGLDRAVDFVRTLDLDAAFTRSRFAAYRERLAALTELLDHDGPTAAFDRFETDHVLNSVALTESQELVGVLPYVQSLPVGPARQKLQIALQGRKLPTEETGNSNAGRNTMFELNLGARLTRGGLQVDVSGEADLAFMNDGVRWFGECKRPSKVETIEDNMGEACRQLGTRLASSHLAGRGLVAISVSAPLAARAAFLEFEDQLQLRAVLKERVRSMVLLMKERIEGTERCRRVGALGLLFVHLVLPAWDSLARRPTSVQYSGGTDLCSDGSGDGDRLWRTIHRTFDIQ